MRHTLLLWDIDGTLITTDRAGERALLLAVKEMFNIDLGEKFPVDLHGRTDRIIAKDILEHIAHQYSEELMTKFANAYLRQLVKTLPQGKARVLPGIIEALTAVASHPEIHQGLLTGNLAAGAEIKLSYLGLWHHFSFGAYADDSHNRNELGPFALKRAEAQLGRTFTPDNVIVIGDTPHDVTCGKVISAKTVAVATGAYSVAHLEACNPTCTFADFSDPSGFIRWIEKEQAGATTAPTT